MANFQAVYYRTSDGREPVNEFVEFLDVRRQVVLDNQIDQLNALGPSNPISLSHTARRSRGSSESFGAITDESCTRVLYRRSHNLIVLPHAFRKDSGAVPWADVQEAMGRWG